MIKPTNQSISRTLIKTLLALGLTLTVSLAQAESAMTTNDLPPWFKPELQVHLVAMDLDSAQKTEFREALTDCLSGLQGIVQREIRRGGADIPKRIRRATNRQYSKFDKRMKASLADPQETHWAQYLEGLKVVMAEQAQSR
tara:strand:+ start:1472 stop:1894 length:423 start_codon:yes stop_codon:yes gene_type:complete